MSKSLQIVIENSKQINDINNWYPFYNLPKSEISGDIYFKLLINCLENDTNTENCIGRYTEMMKCIFKKV